MAEPQEPVIKLDVLESGIEPNFAQLVATGEGEWELQRGTAEEKAPVYGFHALHSEKIEAASYPDGWLTDETAVSRVGRSLSLWYSLAPDEAAGEGVIGVWWLASLAVS